MTCGQCGTVNPQEARFCLNCGTRIAAGTAPRRDEGPAGAVSNLQAAVEQVVAERMGAGAPPASVEASLPAG